MNCIGCGAGASSGDATQHSLRFLQKHRGVAACIAKASATMVSTSSSPLIYIVEIISGIVPMSAINSVARFPVQICSGGD